MEEGGGEGSGVRLRVRPDPFLVICRCFSVITALTAVLCIVVNVISAIRSFKDGSNIFNGIFRCYAVLIAIFVAVAETEWEFVTRFWSTGLAAGVLCIGFLKRSRQQKEISREQAIKDLEDLERRREELENLLVEERA